MKRDFGRHLYGAAALVYAGIVLHWHSYDGLLLYLIVGVALVGGITIQFRRTAQFGAIVLAVLYFCLSLKQLPGIIKAPGVYNSWGNFFEQFSLCTGALMVYGGRAAQIGRVLFGVCVISFTLEQAFYLKVTADFVPAWVPPGQMFWAIATTLFFALAAIAILSRRQELLAARLLTAMLAVFGLMIWVPAVIKDPSHVNWSENFVNWAITGVAWILADYLAAQPTSLSTRR